MFVKCSETILEKPAEDQKSWEEVGRDGAGEEFSLLGARYRD